mmetsp:Transcript_15731/g.24179  ORF Transcript_15731/g.24179 Transcript_15731/m.24179 type:complete len:86 (+) Transcript_15731:776-1033(+)
MGCILAEMMICTQPYRKQGADPADRFLFTGDCCYPLTPGDGEEEESVDQLELILGVLGDLDEEDMSFITKSSVFKYVVEHFSGEE